jgi:hypothetical protein
VGGMLYFVANFHMGFFFQNFLFSVHSKKIAKKMEEIAQN